VAMLVVCGACASNKGGGSGGDAGADTPVGGDGAIVDLMPHEHVAEHGYDDVARPGALGAPLTAPEKLWTWISFPDAHCRDGSSTGIGLNLNRASSNVMVFLDQGGACFEPLTCTQNLNHFDVTSFTTATNQRTYDSGIFNRMDPDNPVRDWSFVVVPYCTGDVHAGNQPSGTVTGTDTQQFVGYRNLDVYLSRVVATFPDAQQVLFAGSSAGGFGVLLNADHVARWFAPIPITVISDSGPPLPNSTVPPCLEQRWFDLWGLDRGPMLDCGVDCPSSSDYMIDHVLHFGWRYPSYRGGLISSAADETIRNFISFGGNDCAPTHIGFDAVSPDVYQAGLIRFRDTMTAEHAPFGTFLLGSQTHHIWLMNDVSFAAAVGGTSIKQWVGALLAGNVSNVGP
jgi:hypothetical protein